MQRDMHYYGTYAMARSAGISADVAKQIATAAEFVDDCAGKISVEFEDGALMAVEATAHHTVNATNIDPWDQRMVWVPFHFLPGNEGVDYTERLICRMDSEPARTLVRRNLEQDDAPYYVPLLGITAHVYGDTFSHFGFSGVSSRRNKVINDSFEFEGLDPDVADYIKEKAERFFLKFKQEAGHLANIKSWLAETFSGALGHGAVATYPDRPYLRWSFDYEYPTRVKDVRNNPETFLAACKALHSMFGKAIARKPDLAGDNGKTWGAIEERVRSILAVQKGMEGREAAWKEAARAGDLFAPPESIPDYEGAQWLTQLSASGQKPDSPSALALSGYKFCQAASDHRNFVVRRLLPGYGILVN